MVEAVVFDMDGVIVDSEQRWEAVRRQLVIGSGRPYPDEATRMMQGMSAPEWEAYLHEHLGVPGSPAEIGRRVVARIAESYRDDLPLISGAAEAIRALAARYPLAVASSSNRELIELALELADLADAFSAVVSSEEVERGKPAPDVYFEAASRLGIAPERCAAVEDSSNGLRSAHAAGMRVVAVPNRDYPPAADALALADVVLPSIGELTPEVVEGA
ncbi:HAD family phosphatase [Agromyces sp. SYSU K20354]|uniref:HAD family hydrolase n=1 Tax=Agromyces cavernae TaxID=2898659 RepID=UPI001E5E41F7|nr:HAD family phosphatase [Agromyces cavernae]MCD2440879.1 HAD family phosphatase [Agromyces cavernae]